MAVSIYIPTNSARVFLFSTPFPAFIVCRLFDEGHSDPCKVIFHCSLICISLIMSDVEHLFMCLLVICMSVLEKPLLVLWPIFWLGRLFFWNWATGVAYIFLRLIFCQLLHLLLFSPILKPVLSPCLYFPLLWRSF